MAVDCKHEETYENCQGDTHQVICSDCGVQVGEVACPDAGTWPAEPEKENEQTS